MTLSKQTLDHLLEAESHMRACIKYAASNEKPYVVHHIAKILLDIEHTKNFEDILDMVDQNK